MINKNYMVNESSFSYGMWWERVYLNGYSWPDFYRRLIIRNKYEHAKHIMSK